MIVLVDCPWCQTPLELDSPGTAIRGECTRCHATLNASVVVTPSDIALVRDRTAPFAGLVDLVLEHEHNARRRPRRPLHAVRGAA